MASPLYYAKFVDKQGTTVKVELAIVHPDVSDFGTDRLWAWKLLHEWVSPDDDGDDIALASRYVKSVTLSPVKNAKVATKKSDYFTVKRAGKKHPTVTYTIEVTDAKLLADITKGQGDEVYDYVEPGKGKALTAPPKPGARPPKGKQAPAAGPPGTFADLQKVTLELIKSTGRWSDYVIEHGMLSRWARAASDDDVVSWIGHLEKDHQTQAAALLAIDRELAGQAASAKRLLKLAESKHRPKDSYNHMLSLAGLVPAWWRLGKAKQADAGFKLLAADMVKSETDPAQRAHTLFTIAARGGRWDKATAVVGECLAEGTYRDDLLVPGVVAAFVAGEQKLVAAILKQWAAAGDSSKAGELSSQLLRVCVERSEPGRYLDLLLAWPTVIDDYEGASYALSRVEIADPAAAVELADRLLANADLHSSLHLQSVAIFRSHAPAKADAWLKKHKARLAKWGGGFAYLAAAGRDVRDKLAGASDSTVRDIAEYTPDRELAIAALKLYVEARHELEAYPIIRLVDLGERAWVNTALDKDLAAIAKKPAKDRDLDCRRLANLAAQIGRADLGFAAIKLPGPALRRYSASGMVNGAVMVGDFTTALAALQLVPDDGSNGRVSTAIQAMRRGDELEARPRAVPLRAIDATYARGLIAAGDRDAIEAILAITVKNPLPDDVRVEIDAFLEGRAYAG